MKSYNKELADFIKAHLTNHEIEFTFNEENSSFMMVMGGNESPINTINYRFMIGDKHIIVYGICPIAADSDDEQAILRAAEFFTRVNYGLFCGNFELDMRDGEIRYKVYIDCVSGVPSDDVIENAILRTMMMYDRYGNGIVDVIFRDVPAEVAFDKCEKNEEHSMLSRIQAAVDSMGSDDIENMLTMIKSQLGIGEDDATDEPDEE